MTPTRPIISALLLLLLATGCRPSTPNTGLPTVQMPIGSKSFTLEIARNDETRARGLMRRDSMPADHGMIFVFDTPQVLSFYMKNTRIPLDIVFVTEDGVVDSVRQMKPYDQNTTSSQGRCKWAIELNEGSAADAGLKAGDKLSIPDAARSADP